MTGPAFRYYGGKGRMAPWLCSLFPKHVSYVEPFFGAGAVLLNKPEARHEVINDLDSNVTNFYQVVRDHLAEFAEACRLTPYARDEFNYCRDNYTDDDAEPVERARRFFTVVSQSFACTTGTASGWSCSTHKNVNRAKSTQHYVDRFGLVADRMRDVMIENTDAATVIERHARAGTVVYLDPPYVHDTRSASGGHGYRHEMSDDDHRRIAAAANATDAVVFVSGYNSDLYADLYDGWHVATRAAYSTVAGRGDRASTQRTEVVWSNRTINEGRLF